MAHAPAPWQWAGTLGVAVALAAGASGCSMFKRKGEPAAVVAPAAAAPVAPTPAPVAPPAAAPVPAPPAQPQLTRIRVPDMEDLCCATKVETILAGTPGVRSAKVDFPSRIATIGFLAARTSPAQLVTVLRAAGWKAEAVAER